MKGIKCLLFPLLLAAAVSMPRTVSAYSFEPGFRMKVIAEYEYDRSEYDLDSTTAKRYFTGLSIVDGSGHLIQWWLLNNGSDGASYSRWERTYDDRGNVTNEAEYDSTKSEPGQTFSVVYPSNRVVLLPELDERLVNTIFTQYDRFGHEKASRRVDGTGKLLDQTTWQYDSHGRQVSSHQEKGDGTAPCDSTTTYSKDNLVSTEIVHDCGQGSTAKDVIRKDKNGNDILDETYSISKKDGTLILTNRAAYSYSGDITNLEWTFWKDNGEPASKLLIVDKGDYEISRKTFLPAPASSQSRERSQWIAAEEETRERTFDKSGVIVKEIWRRRESPDKPFKVELAYERVVTYY
jgi:hypothetical protein